MELLKRFIRESADKEARKLSFWVVKPELVRKYNITTEPSKEIQELMIKKRKEPEVTDDAEEQRNGIEKSRRKKKESRGEPIVEVTEPEKGKRY